MNDYLDDFLQEERKLSFLFSCKFARLYDEVNYESHNHIEIDVLMSGEGAYLIDGIVYPVKAGDVLIINPGVFHKSLVTNPENPLIECFTGLTDGNGKDCDSHPLRLKGKDPIITLGGEAKLKIFHLCSDLLEECTECRVGRNQMLDIYLQQLVLLIQRQEAKTENQTVVNVYESIGKRYIVEQIVSYLKDHYQDKISLELLAETIHLSPVYISKIFKSETGDTPINYLISIRLEKAKTMLEAGTRESIQQVALEVGYEDVYHFSKLFKKRFGNAPSYIKK